MNLKLWTAGIAVFTLAAAPTFAADLEQWSYDQQVIPVGCDTGCDDTCCDDTCCGIGAGGSGLFSGMGPGYVEGFTLAGALGVDRWDIGGWTQFGWTDDNVPQSSTRNDALAFLDSPDRFNLHQQWFYIGKEADGSKGFDLGFRADIMYGVDAVKTQAFGNPAGSWDFDNGFDRGAGYGWAIPQLYGEVAMGDLSVIIGHFYTIVGYEVVPAPDNFFFSHALTMFNSEPFTHTGVLGTYSGFENLTLYGGWTLGWDSGFDNLNSGNNFIGGFSASLSDAVTFTYVSTYGNFGARDLGDSNSYAHSTVLDVALTDKLNYVFQSDLVGIDATDGVGGPRVDNNDQVGINQYLFYDYNDVLSFGSRIEWWKNDGQSNYEFTTGVNVRLLDNLVIRPEFRKDWTPGAGGDFGGTNRENVACDMILTY